MGHEAIILAGGHYGFEEWGGASCPKLLVPIANRPLIEYTAAMLARVGVDRLLVVLDEHCERIAHSISRHLHDYPLDVRCVSQPMPFGTAGALKEIRADLGTGPFWVISGDLFLQTNVVEMQQVHRDREALATVAAFRTQEAPWEMERIETDPQGSVKAIHRIHPAQNKRSTLRPAGLYLLESTALDVIPKGRYFDLKEQLLPLLHQCGTPATVWESSGYGRALVSIGDALAANRDVLLNRVPLDSAPRSLTTHAGETAAIGSGATVIPPVVIDPTSTIGRGAIMIGPTAIGAHVEIGEGACLVECVVYPAAKIGRGAQLIRCIIGEGSVVRSGEKRREVVALEAPVKRRDGSQAHGHRVSFGTHGLMIMPDKRPRHVYVAVKRALDVVLSSILLVALLPLLLIIAVAVRLDSPGAVIFRQPRCGLFGKQFMMLKFRTMVPGAESLIRTLINEVDGPMFKMASDPRVTRLGKFLRATNLDELPQLWNVLRGEMSLVGPRPLAMQEMQFNPRWRDIRLSVKPGLTGLWQVSAPSKLAFAEWIRHDIRYVRKLSLWLDLKILFATLLQPLRRPKPGGD